MGDSELIAAAVAGEKAALEQLVGRHAPRVYRFAMRICRNQEDAQEILQDTFLRAIRSLGTFRGDSQFPTWLFRIVVTSCAKVRKQARRGAGPRDSPGGSGRDRRGPSNPPTLDGLVAGP